MRDTQGQKCRADEDSAQASSAQATGSRGRPGALSFAQRLPAPFARLGWKLTLSYTLVTAAALAAVEILALGILVAVVNSPRFLPGLPAKALIESSSEVHPFLKGEVPDIRGLESLLLRASRNGSAAGSGAVLTISLAGTSFKNPAIFWS